MKRLFLYQGKKMSQSISAFMHQLIHIDLANDENVENYYNDLIRDKRRI